MTTRGRHLTFALLALLLVAFPVGAAEVTIYRCTDAYGSLTLRDTPCRAGEKQETRSMLRPKDPPPRPAPAPTVSAPEPRPAEPATRYVVVTPPKPLYECISPDGERYTSETSQGRSRWQSAWAGGLPVVAHPRDRYSGGYGARIDYRSRHISGSVRLGDPWPPHPRPPHPDHPPVAIVPVYPGGQWVYDECYPLPQAEVCDRLRDERHELNRRWNIAQPSERAQIDRQTRTIDARLGNDCGGN